MRGSNFFALRPRAGATAFSAELSSGTFVNFLSERASQIGDFSLLAY